MRRWMWSAAIGLGVVGAAIMLIQVTQPGPVVGWFVFIALETPMLLSYLIFGGTGMVVTYLTGIMLWTVVAFLVLSLIDALKRRLVSRSPEA